MNFIEPGGRISVMKSSPLPAPLHTAPSFLRFPFLSAADKFAITRALAPLTLTAQRDTGQSFQQWLDAHGQTKTAVARFWHPILISALSEDLDRISVSSAAQVVRESMKTPAARHMGVPALPLTDLYNAAGDYVRARNGVLHFRRPVEGFTAGAAGVQLRIREQESNASAGAPLLPDVGRIGNFDYLVVALPFDALDSILPATTESTPIREQISHFENSPITGIHLWFDRQISDLDHAVLLDRTIQWMFHKSRLQPMRIDSAAVASAAERRQNAAHGASRGSEFNENSLAPSGRKSNPGAEHDSSGIPSYIELVVSSSKTLIEKSRSEIVDLALKEVREFFPAARDANLVKSTVIKEVNATYSPRPGIDVHRPTPITPWPRVFLAGDWTATGWPATMEGAVRSGYLAAEALLRTAGLTTKRFISPDMPASGLMRLFS
jgi:zeta-carotene desaturase